jgi:uncharacterized protein YejL (UPF0352 family)
METNLSINKEIIKNLLDSSIAKAGEEFVANSMQSKLQQTLKSLQGEYVNQ